MGGGAAWRGSLPDAATIIRSLAASGARIWFSKHARDEMRKDELNEVDVREGLVGCSVVRCELHGMEWRFTCRSRSRLGAIFEAPVEIVPDGEGEALRVVSVMTV